MKEKSAIDRLRDMGEPIDEDIQREIVESVNKKLRPWLEENRKWRQKHQIYPPPK